MARLDLVVLKDYINHKGVWLGFTVDLLPLSRAYEVKLEGSFIL